MPNNVSWVVRNRIVVVEVYGLLTIDEIREFSAQAFQMIASSTRLVHFIIDTRLLQKVESIPEALKMIQHSPRHPNLGWMIVVGTINPRVQFFADFVGSLTRTRYRRFDSLSEAIEFLKQQDQTLALV